MVYLQHRIVERKILHAVFQFLIKYHAALVQILVVDADGQHIVAENIFRNDFSPRHFAAGLERRTDILEIEIPAIIRDVADRHIGIQEGQRLLLLRRHRFVEHCKQVAVGQFLLFRLEILFHLRAVGLVGDKVRLLAATCQHEQAKQKAD